MLVWVLNTLVLQTETVYLLVSVVSLRLQSYSIDLLLYCVCISLSVLKRHKLSEFAKLVSF